MSPSKATRPGNYWNIRFGQIFRYQLAQWEEVAARSSLTQFQDCFYFHPEEEAILEKGSFSLNPYDILDLKKNVDSYRRYFSPRKVEPPPPLISGTGDSLDVSWIWIPALESYLRGKPEERWTDFMRIRSAGFDLRMVETGDQLDQNKPFAKACVDFVTQAQDLRRGLVFLTHGSGLHAFAEVLQDRNFEPFRERIRAIVSLAGKLTVRPAIDHEPVMAISQAATKLLRFFHSVRLAGHNEEMRILEASQVKFLKLLLERDFSWGRGLHLLFHSLEEVVKDLAEIPFEESHTFLEDPKEPVTWQEILPAHTHLFTVSAISPPELWLEPSKEFPQNPDDLFLFLISRLSNPERSPYHDGLVEARQTRLPASVLPNALHLGTVRADHWGLGVGKVLNCAYEDPFPRPALFESIILALAEFFTQR